jgi:hypothetical protein
VDAAPGGATRIVLTSQITLSRRASFLETNRLLLELLEIGDELEVRAPVEGPIVIDGTLVRSCAPSL